MQTLTIKLRALMRDNPPIASPSDTIQAAAAAMSRAGASAISVISVGRVVGILTERHITQNVVARGLDPASTAVADVMESEPVLISEDREIECAMLVMRARHAHALIVQDFTGKVLGAVSACDLLAAGAAR